MKVPGLTIACCVLLQAWGAAAEEVKKPLPAAELIVQMGSEDFRTREQATLELWRMGGKALADLRTAAASDDPERAWRAADLVRKIEYDVTPETDPAVLGQVDRYEGASRNDKFEIYRQLTKLRAWRQMLKLYSQETPEQRQGLQAAVRGVAVIAARERLIAGDGPGAREFLEMNMANAEGLLALAAFHRAQGTLPREIQRAGGLKSGKNGWLLALHRASGDVAAARKDAEAAGDARMAAAMAIFQGDPLPWLEQNGNGNEDMAALPPYADVARRRWLGQPIRANELEPLVRMMASKNEQTVWQASATLFLLGERSLAEQRLSHLSTEDAFEYYDALERPLEALKVMGFDPEQPDIRKWAAKLIPDLIKNDDDDLDHTGDPASDLIRMAGFLEKRGWHKELADAYLPPLREIMEKDPGAFSEFLHSLYQETGGATAVTQFALLLSREWAGNDAQRWRDIYLMAMGEDVAREGWWNWMAELDPAATNEEKIKGMLALFTNAADPENLRDRWLSLAWKVIAITPENARPALVRRIHDACLDQNDAGNFMKAWKLLPAEQREEILLRQSGREWDQLIANFSATGSWQEAADLFLLLIEKNKDPHQRVRPQLYSYAAASLRRCGREKEAAEYDAWADRLALGDPAASLLISRSYAYGRDAERSEKWLRRAMLECQPDSSEFTSSLQFYAQAMVDGENWSQAASTSEVLAHLLATTENLTSNPSQALRMRLQADTAHAFATLKSNRAYAIATLERCHRAMAGDAALADYFFPGLRRAGLMQEHDAWFEQSWGVIQAVVTRFPEGANTLNSAAWLASRANRHLEDAEKLLTKALSFNPHESAYLDTMAELQHARGDGKKAVQWSDRALNYSPADSQLWQQNQRFRQAASRH